MCRCRYCHSIIIIIIAVNVQLSCAVLLFAHAIQLAFMQKTRLLAHGMMIYAHLIAFIDERIKCLLIPFHFDYYSQVRRAFPYQFRSSNYAYVFLLFFVSTVILCHCDCSDATDRQTMRSGLIVVSNFRPIPLHIHSQTQTKQPWFVFFGHHCLSHLIKIKIKIPEHKGTWRARTQRLILKKIAYTPLNQFRVSDQSVANVLKKCDKLR